MNMDSGETNSDSVPVLSSGGTDDAMNDADDTDVADEVNRPVLAAVRNLHLTCLSLEVFSTVTDRELDEAYMLSRYI